jgi:hypothetical protein
MVRYLINDELERTWKEAIMAYLNVLFLNIPGGLRKTMKNVSQVN